jgi:CheY-like chemotaxis protein
LLVEDNAMNRDLISRRLSNNGYEVITAEAGELGIEKAHDASPDLILMDLSLPDMDGSKVTKRLKESSSLESIPIVAITAHATKKEREKALDAGCEDYESKPVNFERLIEKIDDLLA